MTFEKANNMIDDISWSYGGKSITKDDMIACREKCHEALEKQIPKAVVVDKAYSQGRYSVAFCPNCKKTLGLLSFEKDFEHCYKCGQKLLRESDT